MTVSVKAPTSTTGSIQLNGSDVLTIDSSGNLTAPNNLTVTGSITGDGSGLTGVSAGKILQVVQTVKTNSFTTPSASLVDITGLSVSITPSSASNKILVMFTCNCGNWTGGTLIQLYRDASAIATGTSGSSRNGTGNASAGYASVDNRSTNQPVNFIYLDSPSTTSSVTYKLQGSSDGSQTLYVNRNYGGDTGIPSHITVMEVAG